MTAFIILPGIGGSEPAHWQSRWEAADPAFVRFAPSSWDQPDLGDWIAALDRAVADAPAPPVLVAHSLACLLVAHWAARSEQSAAGAFLVATPDPSGPNFPAEAIGFAHPPAGRLGLPAVMLASADDPYSGFDHTRRRAAGWDAALIELGPIGHVNASSGIGDWAEGRRLLAAFAAGLAR